jgi:hypothetical protein
LSSRGQAKAPGLNDEAAGGHLAMACFYGFFAPRQQALFSKIILKTDV